MDSGRCWKKADGVLWERDDAVAVRSILVGHNCEKAGACDVQNDNMTDAYCCCWTSLQADTSNAVFRDGLPWLQFDCFLCELKK